MCHDIRRMDQQFRVAEIEVSKATMDEKIIGVFRYESDPGRHKRGATLIMLAEIASTLYAYEQLLDVLNVTAEQARYLTSGFDVDPMARFEKLIQRLNDAVAHFVEKEPSPISWGRINIFVMELSEGHLCLAGIGRLSNIFFQKQEDGSYKPFDLFGSLEQPAEVDPVKPFSSLICGDVRAGDVLFAGTLNFERLRNELLLSERVTKEPPVTAALNLKQDLERRNIPDDFAGVIVAAVDLPSSGLREHTPSEEEAHEASIESVQKLYAEERETEAMLSPALAPLPNAAGTPFLKKIGAGAHRVMADGIERVQTWMADRKKPKTRDPLAMASLRGLNAGHGNFMTPKRKATLLGGSGIILAALIGTLWFQHAKKAAAEQTIWNDRFGQAQEAKNRAEADLVYGNESQAQDLLRQAEAMLASLDEKTRGRKQKKLTLIDELGQLKNKLKHEITVERPDALFVSQLGDGALKTPVVLKDKVYALDGDAVLALSPSTRETKHLTLPANLGAQKLLLGANSLLVMAGERTLLSLDPATGKIANASWNISKASSTQFALTYNRKMYALDPAKNMIWKYAPSGTGFGADVAYLKHTTTDLSGASSLAIDSNVYVAFANGKLMRWLSGVEENWSPSQIDPPLEHAASIWTTPDTDRVAVTDPVGRRIVVFRKDGALVAQIVSRDFQGPRDIVGDDKAKKIYVVDGNRLFAFDLP